MYREILNELSAWKDQSDRKPMLIVGAKGVGKSYVVKDFGEGFFENYVILDLKVQDFIRYLFEEDFNVERVEKMLSVSCGDRIRPGETLIIVENVENVKNLDKLLEFFMKKMSSYHVCLTTSCDENYVMNSTTTEYVDIIHLYPLSFSEFLRVNKEADICSHIEHNMDTPLTEHQLRVVNDYMKLYYYVGGMPSVVNCWIEEESLARVKEEKDKLNQSYLDEFDKVEDKTLRNKIHEVYKSLGEQLLRENKKFMFGAVKLTARAREYGDAVEWLITNKFVTKVNRACTPSSPLADYEDVKSYELFMVDIGMLADAYSMTYDDIAEAFRTTNGKMMALTEQFVADEMMMNKNIGRIFYWISEATAKINFLFEDSGNVIPVEINLYNNSKAQSIKVYRERYMPEMFIRITMNSFSMEKDYLQLPLFSIWNI